MVIGVEGSGIKRIITYFSTALRLQILENYGELKVTDENGIQVPKVYVKTFIMKKDGGVMFYKDGYTDIRGRFDYASLNTSQIDKTERFAIFVTSETHGSLIRECSPPAHIVHVDEELEPIQARLAKYYSKLK